MTDCPQHLISDKDISRPVGYRQNRLLLSLVENDEATKDLLYTYPKVVLLCVDPFLQAGTGLFYGTIHVRCGRFGQAV